MTWHNTPCPPTLAALSEACPHGWAEIQFNYHAGNATADPPQDADCSIWIRRLWGVDNSDEPALADLLDDLREPPMGVPATDFTLLARMVHFVEPCNTCGRQRAADDEGWWCWPNWGDGTDPPDDACPGAFPAGSRLEVCWGPDKALVYFLGHSPVYAGSASP
ncbi:MAG: hypothetical protein VW516_05910 [Rhodospirillaceae bacterium]|jgi:hypothetical protein